MKADQERVSNLLTDTVTLLCRNGLQYKTEMKVQGLLGITLDDEVFLVQIDKKFGDLIGADLMALQQEGDLENHENQHQDQSGDDTSEGRTSPSGRKRNRIKQKRKKSDSANSDPDSPSAKVSNILVKSEPCQEEEDDEDDLVMIESDDKVGLHDKDTMRESYGVSYNNDLAQSESNADLLQNMAPVGQSNSSFLTSYNNDGSRLLDQAGCSAWDDPLSALTDPSNSVAPQGGSSSGGDDTMDQQTMSTMSAPRSLEVLGNPVPVSRYHATGSLTPNTDLSLSLHQPVYGPYNNGNSPSGNPINYFMNIRTRRSVDNSEKNYACGYPGCDKAYLSRNNLLHHQAYKHGRRKGEKGPVIMRK